jgi:hypothetical protein
VKALDQVTERPEQRPEQLRDKKIGEARFDLVVRFVAVAISVGFASSLASMQWVKEGVVPTPLEWQEVIRLLTALFVVISGWEWFHRDTSRDETYTSRIFMLDIVVVVTSLIFLVSFRSERIWLYSIGLIFLLYVVWDVLSGRYKTVPNALWVNIMWFGYFLLIIAVTLTFPLRDKIHFPAHEKDVSTLLCLAVVGGIVVLRRDEGKFEWWKRLGIAAIMFAIYFWARYAAAFILAPDVDLGCFLTEQVFRGHCLIIPSS